VLGGLEGLGGLVLGGLGGLGGLLLGGLGGLAGLLLGGLGGLPGLVLGGLGGLAGLVLGLVGLLAQVAAGVGRLLLGRLLGVVALARRVRCPVLGVLRRVLDVLRRLAGRRGPLLHLRDLAGGCAAASRAEVGEGRRGGSRGGSPRPTPVPASAAPRPAAPPLGVGRSSALPLRRRPVHAGELQEAVRVLAGGGRRGGAGAGRGGARGRERKGGERVTGEVEPVAAAETLAPRMRERER